MVKFRTKFNSESTASLNKAQIKKFLWIYVILSLMLVVFGISKFLAEVITESDIITGVILIALGIALIPVLLLMTKAAQKKIDNSMSILSENTEEIFSFDTDKIYIETVKGEQYKSYVEASYSYLYKVVENADSYFLYISKMQCHVIAKKYLVEGNLFELNDILKCYFSNIKTSGNTITYYNDGKK
ncbi:MAG: YcxB family protein [Candidatus Borkfalkiaceae bacterium]|nr:YcxB family protein [Christensenellaceae bacterium]